MATSVPSTEHESDPSTHWKCTHCGHCWNGKSKEARASAGNPTCSNCSRRSGAVETPEEKIEDQPDETPSALNIPAETLLAAAVLKGAEWLYEQTQSPGDQVM